MKILIVSSVPTTPIIAGNRKLIQSYAELFKEWGHEVHFLYVYRYYINSKRRKDYKTAIKATKLYWGEYYHQYNYSIGENLISNFKIIWNKIFNKNYRKVDDIYPEGLNSTFLEINNKHHFDAIIVNYFYLSKLLDIIKIPRKAIFTHDSFSLFTKSPQYQAAYYLTKEEEQKALKRAPYIFAMQDVEGDYFKSLAPKSNILINYSHYKYHIQPKSGNHNILFLSGKSIFNKTGIIWFIDKIFPLIKSNYKDAQLCIAGSISDVMTEYKNVDGIKILGRVNDPAAFFLEGDIAINPCQQGTGLKIKTFESLSYDKITMVHPHSLIGVFQKDKAPIFASTSPKEWLEYIKKVWEEEGFIEKKKIEIQNYMNEMNNFIKDQYRKFLNE